MFEVGFLILVAAVMAGAWWWLKRRRRELLGLDEPGDTEATAPQALTREALMNRPRDFDPNAWDDGPAPAARPASTAARPTPAHSTPARPAAARPTPPAPSEEDEAPAYFDREFLARRQRERQGEPPADRAEAE